MHLLGAAGGFQSRAVASGGWGPLSKVRVVAHGGESEQPEQGSRSESPPREAQSLHQLILNEDTEPNSASHHASGCYLCSLQRNTAP